MGFWKIFKKQMSPEEAVNQLNSEIREMDGELRGFEYDLERARAEREQLMSDGVDAYENGDEDRCEELQEDLELLNNEINQISDRKGTLRKKRYLYRQAASNLKYAPQSERQSMALLDDPELMGLVNAAEINEDRFREEVARRYGIETQRRERERNIKKQRRGENPFKALSEAMKSGDAEQVARAKEMASGKKTSDKAREEDLLA